MTTKVTAQQVINAIDGTLGNKSEIGRRLNVTRQTVTSYIERWASVKQAYDKESGGVTDIARENVVSSIIDGDLAMSKWWLTQKDPDFSERLHHTGAIQVIIDYADDTSQD